jgi:hypothetical protein
MRYTQRRLMEGCTARKLLLTGAANVHHRSKKEGIL